MRLHLLPALLALGCDPHDRKHRAPEDPACAESWIADGEVCVPESCGAGTWGALPVDEATVYVDAAAADGGDGSAEAPLRSIQPALDLAGDRGGGLVAVAAGTYTETLTLTSDHAGVHLAGRCRELVTLDASVGDGETAGIDIDSRYGEVEVSGMGVVGSNYMGILVGSGVVRLVDSSVEGSAYTGIMAFRGSTLALTCLEVEDCKLVGNAVLGLLADGSGIEVTLFDTDIRDTLPNGEGDYGRGINLSDGAILEAEGCTLERNAELGVYAHGEGTRLLLLGSEILDTRPHESGYWGHGIEVSGGASASLDGCRIAGNTRAGLVATGAGTDVALEDVRIEGTVLGAEDGWALLAMDSAALRARGCQLVDNLLQVGLRAQDPGTSVYLENASFSGQAAPDGGVAYGIVVLGGAAFEMEDCTLEESRAAGLMVRGAGTSSSIRDVRFLHLDSESTDWTAAAVFADTGARLTMESCRFEDIAGVGVLATNPGTTLSIRDTFVQGTRPATGQSIAQAMSFSDEVQVGVDTSALLDNTGGGIYATGSGTSLTLRDVIVAGTRAAEQPIEGGLDAGGGVFLSQGARLDGERVDLSENAGLGLLAMEGTAFALRELRVQNSKTTARYGLAAGLYAIEGAHGEIENAVISGNQGPGVVALDSGASLRLDGCRIEGSEFAGAIVGDAALELFDSAIEGSVPSVNSGGGWGIWVDETGTVPPSVHLDRTTILGSTVGGLWLGGDGAIEIVDSEIEGGEGQPHGGGMRCGDAIYARGTRAWDGSSGLLVATTSLHDSGGAGLFLDGSGASLDGVSWFGNTIDVLAQGEDCDTPPVDAEGAATMVLCPEWDQPTCQDTPSVTLELDQLRAGFQSLAEIRSPAITSLSPIVRAAIDPIQHRAFAEAGPLFVPRSPGAQGWRLPALPIPNPARIPTTDVRGRSP